jgi:hypothetical protein
VLSAATALSAGGLPGIALGWAGLSGEAGGKADKHQGKKHFAWFHGFNLLLNG